MAMDMTTVGAQLAFEEVTKHHAAPWMVKLMVRRPDVAQMARKGTIKAFVNLQKADESGEKHDL